MNDNTNIEDTKPQNEKSLYEHLKKYLKAYRQRKKEKDPEGFNAEQRMRNKKYLDNLRQNEPDKYKIIRYKRRLIYYLGLQQKHSEYEFIKKLALLKERDNDFYEWLKPHIKLNEE